VDEFSKLPGRESARELQISATETESASGGATLHRSDDFLLGAGVVGRLIVGSVIVGWYGEGYVSHWWSP
jgi:hypothetical protein